MMNPGRFSLSSRRGFTIIEMVVGMVVGLLLMASVVQLLTVQGRGYRKQREVIDIRETAREAVSLLTWDLRQAGLGSSPLASINANTISLRSTRGIGTVCGKHATLARYGLWKSGGNITASPDDSALVYQFARDKWQSVKITAVGTPATMGVTACAWPGARPPDIVVEFAVAAKGDTAFIKVGSPFRNFRLVQYGEVLLNGRWWLGRRVGGAASYEQLTGPLVAPGSGGLAFAYYDTLGAVTGNPAAVGAVGLTVRTESFKKTYVANTFDFERDSLFTKVVLRR